MLDSASANLPKRNSNTGFFSVNISEIGMNSFLYSIVIL